MSLQIKGKFISNEAIDGDKIKLNWDAANDSTQALRAFDENGNEIEVIKVEHEFDINGNKIGTKTYSDGELLAKNSQIANLQTELDDTQSGAGLDTDGSYIPDAGTEYISDAVSLADADSKLDAAVKNIWDQRNQNNGFAGLDQNGLINPSQIPKIALTSVTVVPTIADRDNLADQEEGDVVKVAQVAPSNLPKTYIRTSSNWIEIESGSDVDTVNGYTGTVVLNADDILMVSKPLVSVEDELVNIADDVSKLVLLSGVGVDSVNLGSFTGSTIADSRTVKTALQDLETAHEAVTDDVSKLVLLSGVGVDSVNLGTFTGATIADSRTVKAALQDLESAHEAHVNDLTGAHNASAIAVNPAINGLTDVQAVLADHEDRVVTLESRTHDKKDFVLTSTDVSNGYVDLPHLAVDKSIVASVGRLMIHEGASYDFTLSSVGGVTRITFVNNLVDPGQEKLAAGDIVFVKYEYLSV